MDFYLTAQTDRNGSLITAIAGLKRALVTIFIDTSAQISALTETDARRCGVTPLGDFVSWMLWINKSYACGSGKADFARRRKYNHHSNGDWEHSS